MFLHAILRRLVPDGRDRFPRRLIQLFAGLFLYGFSDGLLVLAGLGLDPWDVFHQGLARHSSLPIGTWAIIVGAGVMLLWTPLRQWPGLGTLCNVVVIGLVINATIMLIPAPTELPLRVLTLVAAVVLNGVATGAYIGAGLGPGPRDGLMTGLARRGHSIRVVRTCIELTVLVTGFLLGGTVGIGTVLYAASIGPLAHIFIPLLSVKASSRPQEIEQDSAPHHDAAPTGSPTHP
jgi:uncharacterized membrane protein YczE